MMPRKMGICASGEELSLGLCYPAARPGYSCTGPLCQGTCPSNTTDAGLTCTKTSYYRGPGHLPTCGSDQEDQEGLCYTKCRQGFHGFYTICSRDCPAGFRDVGLYCTKPDAYGRGTGWSPLGQGKAGCESSDDPGAKQYGCEQWTGTFPLTDLWYPKCAPHFHNVGCCICSPDCPAGWDDAGVSCRKPDTYDRGVGVVASQCSATEDNFGGVCYPKCRDGYYPFGVTCYSSCPNGTDKGVYCDKPTYGRGVGTFPSIANLAKQYIWVFIGIGIILFLIILAIAYFTFRSLF